MSTTRGSAREEKMDGQLVVSYRVAVKINTYESAFFLTQRLSERALLLRVHFVFPGHPHPHAIPSFRQQVFELMRKRCLAGLREVFKGGAEEVEDFVIPRPEGAIIGE